MANYVTLAVKRETKLARVRYFLTRFFLVLEKGFIALKIFLYYS